MTEGARLHYKEYGRASHSGSPPLVLVHGAGGDLMQWPSDLRRLRGQRVYALDLPGHGKTGSKPLADIGAYADAVQAWAGELALPPFVLMGHSMGGAIALEFALRYGSRLSGLVLLGAGARLRVAPQILAGLQNDFDATVGMLVGWMYGEGADPNLLRLGARRLRQVPSAVLHADFAACDAFDRREEVHLIDAPTLILCGDADVMTPLKSSQFLQQQIPRSQLEVFPGGSHMIALQHPQWVAAQVQEFLGRLQR